jgi:hypothetical protein
MREEFLPAEALEAVHELGRADIVIGILSY